LQTKISPCLLFRFDQTEVELNNNYFFFWFHYLTCSCVEQKVDYLWYKKTKIVRFRYSEVIPSNNVTNNISFTVSPVFNSNWFTVSSVFNKKNAFLTTGNNYLQFMLHYRSALGFVKINILIFLWFHIFLSECRRQKSIHSRSQKYLLRWKITMVKTNKRCFSRREHDIFVSFK